MAASADMAVTRFQLCPGGTTDGFDPWIEIIADAFRHNVGETARLAGGTRIMAVIKNNAYGLGDQVVGPIVDACAEVAAIACTRVAEALALRAAGVTKPILLMAETSTQEMVELARHAVWPSVWLDDALQRLTIASRQLGRPIAVHACLDAGMGREGMPLSRARPFIESLCQSPASVTLVGTYITFPHVLELDREILARFLSFVADARRDGLDLGLLHAAPSFEILYLPASRFDLVHPGALLFGNYRKQPELTEVPDLHCVFRLCARVVRLERLRVGDTANFRRGYVAKRPTWVALVPVGHTDGYPAAASNTCVVRIRERLFPVVGEVSSSHVIIEIGDTRSVEVGDVVTLIGPDAPEITPHAVAEKAGIAFYHMITRLSPLLPKQVVSPLRNDRGTDSG